MTQVARSDYKQFRIQGDSHLILTNLSQKLFGSYTTYVTNNARYGKYVVNGVVSEAACSEDTFNNIDPESGINGVRLD